ncbi:hypothetical protein BDN67DRAFT_1015792 [Paxillus ammoniavirescens]|nr:hypothetical protein BDN67DRAFT_1015792 [Paxillus ammoniavirescens]
MVAPTSTPVSSVKSSSSTPVPPSTQPASGPIHSPASVIAVTPPVPVVAVAPPVTSQSIPPDGVLALVAPPVAAPPPIPPKPALNSREETYPMYGRYMDRCVLHPHQGQPEWSAQPRQQIGGGYAQCGGYRQPGHFFPYDNGEGLMIPPHAMIDNQRGVLYGEEMYRGDPHRIYGGFHGREGPSGPGGYQDFMDGVPPYQTHPDEFRPYRELHRDSHQRFGPALGLGRGPSPVPSSNTQLHPPYPRASAEPREGAL